MEKPLSYRYLCSTDLFNFLHWHFDVSILSEPHDLELSARPSFRVGTTANCDGPSLNCTVDSEKLKSRASREAEFLDWYSKWEKWSRDDNGFPEFSESYISELGPLE